MGEQRRSRGRDRRTRPDGPRGPFGCAVPGRHGGSVRRARPRDVRPAGAARTASGRPRRPGGGSPGGSRRCATSLRRRRRRARCRPTARCAGAPRRNAGPRPGGPRPPREASPPVSRPRRRSGRRVEDGVGQEHLRQEHEVEPFSAGKRSIRSARTSTRSAKPASATLARATAAEAGAGSSAMARSAGKRRHSASDTPAAPAPTSSRSAPGRRSAGTKPGRKRSFGSAFSAMAAERSPCASITARSVKRQPSRPTVPSIARRRKSSAWSKGARTAAAKAGLTAPNPRGAPARPRRRGTRPAGVVGRLARGKAQAHEDVEHGLGDRDGQARALGRFAGAERGSQVGEEAGSSATAKAFAVQSASSSRSVARNTSSAVRSAPRRRARRQGRRPSTSAACATRANARQASEAPRRVPRPPRPRRLGRSQRLKTGFATAHRKGMTTVVVGSRTLTLAASKRGGPPRPAPFEKP